MDDYFRFSCPGCGKTVKARRQSVGARVRCTKCGSPFTVPPVPAAGDPMPPPAPQKKRPQVSATEPAFEADKLDEVAVPAPPQYVVVEHPAARTDAPGVISLIFGSLGLVLLVFSCLFTCIGGFVLYPVVASLGVAGIILGFFARGNLRVAGIVLNALTLVPAVIMFVMLFTGVVGTAAIVAAKASREHTVPIPVVEEAPKYDLAVAKIPAGELWQAYEVNIIEADRKYLDKVVDVEIAGGKVARDDKGYLLGQVIVTLPAMPPSQVRQLPPRELKWFREGHPPHVLCYIHPAALQEFNMIGETYTICTVRGVCKGRRDADVLMGYVVELKDCILVDKRTWSADPAAERSKTPGKSKAPVASLPVKTKDPVDTLAEPPPDYPKLKQEWEERVKSRAASEASAIDQKIKAYEADITRKRKQAVILSMSSRPGDVAAAQALVAEIARLEGELIQEKDRRSKVEKAAELDDLNGVRPGFFGKIGVASGGAQRGRGKAKGKAPAQTAMLEPPEWSLVTVIDSETALMSVGGQQFLVKSTEAMWTGRKGPMTDLIHCTGTATYGPTRKTLRVLRIVK